jgi:PemK-like, MazF-like toxin of type II toxin-antitoxin system
VVLLEPAAVVVLRFPFSDLSSSKFRPAIVLAQASSPEWVVCAVTSNPYADATAVELIPAHFVAGGLRGRAFARPLKVFTVDPALVTGRAGKLNQAAYRMVVEPLVNALTASLLL